MTAASRAPMQELADAGQSVWLDYIRRDLIANGELEAMIGLGLRGMTSNPSIFEQAIGRTELYDEAIGAHLSADPTASTVQLFEAVAIADIQAAADAFRPVHEAAAGGDGFVSLEVSPDLAHDTEGTIAEAHRLWAAVDRPNLMIKVPATPAGLPAIEQLIAAGINVNVTLMFSAKHYEDVAQAYLRGIAQCADPHRVASVASVFVSRIDSAVDAALEAIGTDEAKALKGRIAIANSKAIYQRSKELFGDDFEAEWGRGVIPQRPLWASTSTKDPTYRDVMYVEDLVGAGTVNTVPPATLDAFEDHGEVRAQTVEEDLEAAMSQLAALGRLGIDLVETCQGLQDKGVVAFVDSFNSMLGAIDGKKQRLLAV